MYIVFKFRYLELVPCAGAQAGSWTPLPPLANDLLGFSPFLCHKLNQWTSVILRGSAFQSKWMTPLAVVLHKKTDVARCLFWMKPTEEPEALSASVVPTWLLLVNESLSLIKLALSFRGFDLSELYTELLCNSPYISVFTICSPFSECRHVLLFIHYVSPVYYNKFSQVEIRSRWNLFQALLFHFILQFATC